MKKRHTVLLLIVLLSLATGINAQTPGNYVTETILGGYSSKVFTTGTVSESDLDLILQCGMKAPSGMNSQPWKFTVVKDPVLISSIQQNVTSGNILVVVSGLIKDDGSVDLFASGLATENMYVAAQGLGLGTHIYAGPAANINTNLKDKLGIPSDYKAIVVLRIGNIEKSPDAVSGASTRKTEEDVINVK